MCCQLRHNAALNVPRTFNVHASKLRRPVSPHFKRRRREEVWFWSVKFVASANPSTHPSSSSAPNYICIFTDAEEAPPASCLWWGEMVRNKTQAGHRGLRFYINKTRKDVPVSSSGLAWISLQFYKLESHCWCSPGVNVALKTFMFICSCFFLFLCSLCLRMRAFLLIFHKVGRLLLNIRLPCFLCSRIKGRS